MARLVDINVWYFLWYLSIVGNFAISYLRFTFACTIFIANVLKLEIII